MEEEMDINVTGVWERNITGRGVTVAILDDGKRVGLCVCSCEIVSLFFYGILFFCILYKTYGSSDLTTSSVTILNSNFYIYM